jgi:hypothetical protein
MISQRILSESFLDSRQRNFVTQEDLKLMASREQDKSHTIKANEPGNSDFSVDRMDYDPSSNDFYGTASNANGAKMLYRATDAQTTKDQRKSLSAQSRKNKP